MPDSAPQTNRLLMALPPADYKKIMPDLKPVRLKVPEVLYEASATIEHVYFPQSSMISMLTITEPGTTLEIGMVGREGMVGVPVLLGIPRTPYRAIVQIPDGAFTMKANALRERLTQLPSLQNLLLRYAHAFLIQISQSAVCNRFHTTEQRLCRWLLAARDSTTSISLPFTQEFLSHMMGGPRTGVTMVVGALESAGLIRHRRGQINLLDLRGLEERACECYKVVKNEYEALFQS